MVLHDRDPRFTSQFWQSLWKLFGTKTVFTSAYHTQTDGQTERTHRTIEQCIRCLMSEHGLQDKDWCKVVSHVEFAINNSPSASTQLSPAELVFGARPKQPLDLLSQDTVSATPDTASATAQRIVSLVALAK